MAVVAALLVGCWLLYACPATSKNSNNNNIEAILKFIKNDLRKTQFYFFIATKKRKKERQRSYRKKNKIKNRKEKRERENKTRA